MYMSRTVTYARFTCIYIRVCMYVIGDRDSIHWILVFIHGDVALLLLLQGPDKEENCLGFPFYNIYFFFILYGF